MGRREGRGRRGGVRVGVGRFRKPLGDRGFIDEEKDEGGHEKWGGGVGGIGG